MGNLDFSAELKRRSKMESLTQGRQLSSLLFVATIFVIFIMESSARSLQNDIPITKCRVQSAPCNPYKKECCGDMKCASNGGTYCLFGWEDCFCVPQHYGQFGK